MLNLTLPSPDMHEDWRSFARALISVLEDMGLQGATGSDVDYVISTIDPTVDPEDLPPLPAGFTPLWLNSADANLYLATPDYSPPPAPNIVFIDTQNIAEAAVELQKLADGAVGTSAKLADLVVLNAKVADLTLLRGKIAEAEIVNSKIGDLAVNEAKIANLAVTSGKIANLAVGAAHIQAAAIGTAHIGDAQITNAKIGDTIQSHTWNAGTKAGWLIDKNGNISGRSISIYDSSGELIFGSDGSIEFTRMVFDPDALTGFEKQTTLAQMIALVQTGDEARARAVTLGLSTTALDNARNAWQTYLTNLAPAYDDYTQSTPLTPAGMGVELDSNNLPPNAFPYGFAGSAAITPLGDYFTFTDNDAAAAEASMETFNPVGVSSSAVISAIRVRKDLVPQSVRNIMFRTTVYSDLGGDEERIYFDTFTGAFNTEFNGDNFITSAGVLDVGADWIFYLALAMPSGVWAVQRDIMFYGSGGLTGASFNPAATGYVDVKRLYFFQGDARGFGRDYLLGLFGNAVRAIEQLWKAISAVDATLATTAGLSGAVLTSLATNLIGQFTSSNISTYIASAAIQSAQIADASITSAKIADAQITNAKIADATIQSAKIVSLDASKVNAASLSAITAVIGLLRTATSGQRLEVSSNEIRVYYASGNIALRLGIW